MDVRLRRTLGKNNRFIQRDNVFRNFKTTEGEITDETCFRSIVILVKVPLRAFVHAGFMLIVRYQQQVHILCYEREQQQGRQKPPH